MHLKRGIKIIDFLKEVQGCKDEVLFTTDDGDILNLNSVLSRYIFVTMTEKPELLFNAEIVCSKKEDQERLAEFLTT